MKRMMKAVQVAEPGVMRVIEVARPELDRKNHVLVRMTAAGICGSDLGIYHGTNAAATYPRVIGHEMVGVIAEVGEDVKERKVGERVIVDQVTSCGKCYACRMGRGNVCDDLKVRGVHIDGGYREYLAVPEADCYVLPDSISDVDAVMIEPTTIAIQACTRAGLGAEDMLLLYGYGALGSSVFRIARQLCEDIIVADVMEEKLAEAKAAGARDTVNAADEDFAGQVRRLTKGRGPTVSIDAACVKGSLMKLLQVTGNAGRVITMGFSTEPVEVNQFLITSKELDVRGSRLQNKMFGRTIRMLEEGTLNLDGFVSHTFPLEKAPEAFAFADSRDPSIRKIVLTF